MKKVPQRCFQGDVKSKYEKTLTGKVKSPFYGETKLSIIRVAAKTVINSAQTRQGQGGNITLSFCFGHCR